MSEPKRMPRDRYEDYLDAILKVLDEHPELDNFAVADAVGWKGTTRDAPVGRTRTVLRHVKKLWLLTPRVDAAPPPARLV